VMPAFAAEAPIARTAPATAMLSFLFIYFSFKFEISR
jgi:hypothetical protein